MQFRPTPKHNIALFALLTLIAYGLLLPVTGFYWDDWPFAWIAKFLGPAEFNPAFAPFRPFLGPIFYVTTSLIPNHPLAWQVFALVVRFALGLAAWWMFSQIFPTRKTTAFIAALFMLIFPGYSQHWVALTHINQELIPFLFYLFSFGLTFKALRTCKPTDTVIALLLQLCGIFPTEYFFGIEGIRMLFLLVFFQGSFIQRFTQSLKVWFPYLLIWILNAAWLFYYYRFGPYNSYEVTAAGSPSILPFLTQALDAIWKAGLYIWGQVLVLTFTSLPAPASLLTLGLVALSIFFLIPYLARAAPAEPRDVPFALSLMGIGVIGILLGRLPTLAAGLPLTLQSSYDRFMVSMMIGGTVFLLGLLELLIKNPRARTIAFALVIALGIGQQFFNANIFRRDWKKQGEIYWQMAWRIPALEPNTLLLTHQMPIDYETDNSFTAPINWMYVPEYTRSNLPYLLLYTEKRIGGVTLPALEKGIDINYTYRTVNFNGSTSSAVVLFMPRDGCLRVLDPGRGDALIYSRQPTVLTQAIPLSDVSRIITETANPAVPVFFPEPEHEWCFFFTKAELAQQNKDYEQVVLLGNQAMSLGYKPQDPNEWLVFIEAYALTGDLKTAQDLSIAMLEKDARTRRGVCAVWEQVQARGPAGSEAQIDQILLSFDCNS
ncbi:MAG: hypothetical protein QY332_07935 [Anaerolineales bacterium]|nr:MAG: hypothetical protein QY332_07935 [Anaerolineales bacterium]